MQMVGLTAFIPAFIEYEMEKGTRIILMNPRLKIKLAIPIGTQCLTITS
jgi:hypothetical protein